MKSSLYIYIYIFVMAFATWCMRVIPSLVMKKPIESRFAQSFLYYVPYVTLAVMTFPAILYATGSIWSGLAGFVVGVILAFFDGNLFRVALGSCVAVFVAELLIK